MRRGLLVGTLSNCYDRYVSQWDVATLAEELSQSGSEILGNQTQPKHQIETGKLRALGMEFGGEELLRQTIGQLVEAIQIRTDWFLGPPLEAPVPTPTNPPW